MPQKYIFSSSLAQFIDPRIILPEANAPHWVQRAECSQTLVFRARKMFFVYGWMMAELGVGARKDGILLLPVRNTGVKAAHASMDAFGCS